MENSAKKIPVKANTNNPISEKIMVFRIPYGQEYLSINLFVISISKKIFLTIFYSRVTIIFHYPGLTLSKWPWESCMTKGSLSTLLFAIKTHTGFRNYLLWHFWQYQLFSNSWSFNNNASLYDWNSWVALASILFLGPCMGTYFSR